MIYYVNGKKYLDKQIIEALIAQARGAKGDFQKYLDAEDEKQTRRNFIGTHIQMRQAELIGKPADRMEEIRKKIEAEAAAVYDDMKTRGA